MWETFKGVRVYRVKKFIVVEERIYKKIRRRLKINVDELKENHCRILDLKQGKIAICKRKNKIIVYPLDESFLEWKGEE